MGADRMSHPYLLRLLILSAFTLIVQSVDGTNGEIALDVPNSAAIIDSLEMLTNQPTGAPTTARSYEFTLKYDFLTPAQQQSPPIYELTKDQIDNTEFKMNQAQLLFTSKSYPQVATLLTDCIEAFDALLPTNMTKFEAWQHEPFRSWSTLFFYRALSSLRAGLDDKGAMSDIVQAVAMSPKNPEYWSLRGAIGLVNADPEDAVLSGLHELFLCLGLVGSEEMKSICSFDSETRAYHCKFEPLIDWLELKLDWDIRKSSPVGRMKLWEIRGLEQALSGYHISESILQEIRSFSFSSCLFLTFFSLHSSTKQLQQLVRCLHGLTYRHMLLPLTSQLRIDSQIAIYHLHAAFPPNDAMTHAQISTIMFGEGQPLRALSHGMHDMALQLFATHANEEAPQGINLFHESWTELLRYGALLLSAGMETHLTNMARRILDDPIAGHHTLQNIAQHCQVGVCGVAPIGMTEAQLNNQLFYRTNCTQSISYDLLRHVFTKCLQHQDVLAIVFPPVADSHRASITQTNEFGYNPLHHFALFGEPELLKSLLHYEPKANINAMTHMGFSALHLAALRGHVAMTRTLLELGVKTTWLDFAMRTALDVACIHGFEWNYAVAKQLKPELSEAELKSYCANVRATKSLLDYPTANNSRPIPSPYSSCLQYGQWSPFLIFNRTSMPNPYPCVTQITPEPTPKLSFVSAEEEAKHAQVQAAIREADGAKVRAEDAIDVSTLPQDSPAAKLFSTRCDLPILRPPTSYQQFISQIVSIQRPVLIRGALNWQSLETAPIFYDLQRERFKQKFGHVKLAAAKVPYAETFGLDMDEVTLSQFIDYMAELNTKDQALKTNPTLWSQSSHFTNRSYIFASVPFPEDGATVNESSSEPMAILNMFVSPPWMHPPQLGNETATTPTGELDPTTHTPLQLRKLQFFLGPRFSGAPAHFHRSAVNLQWFGRKHWSIQPPTQGRYGKQESMKARWEATTASTTSSSSTLECIQEAGDLIFIPDFWTHSTINLEESIGWAAELLWGATHFSL